MKGKLYALLVLGLLACGEDETPPVASFEFSDGLDRMVLNGETSKGDVLFYQWSTSDASITIENAYAAESFFKIPAGAGSMDVDVTLTVSDGKFQGVKTASVNVPEYSLIRSLGLGKTLGREASNNVDYEWYLDQSNTGAHSLLNCGPTSVTMAIKWFDQDFTGSPSDARNAYRSGGGWWYTNDILGYLNDHHVNNRTISLDQFSNVKAEIDEGNIVILCLDMYHVSSSKYPEHHLNKFYETNAVGWGHFIVVKGYKEVDGRILYETYDSNSLDRSYPGGGLKGKDRYYSSSDLDAATNTWWDYAIVVERSASEGGRKGVDISQIIHKPGR
ncbi:MAG TPA: C39 family peptidase [Chryseolinea sp.]|nr:C39 family peptidase [Chryseolinea sp.]